MTNTYAMAYTELLEILKSLPKEEYDRIPKEKIEFYEKNKDNNYEYVFDASRPIEEQNISKKTNAIIVSLFRDYFATPVQKEKLERILKQNDEQNQKELTEKYNPDNIFKKKTSINTNEQSNEKMLIIIEKENIFKRIINKIKKIFR